MTPGLDVSHHQPPIDWPRVHTAGMRWAYLRTCHGVHRDREWLEHLQGARAAGLRVGAYQYLRRDQPVRQQADWLAEVLSLSVLDLPPVIDIEDGAVSREDLRSWLFWMEQHTGMAPAIYGSACVLSDLIGTDEAWSRYPLWVADYGRPAGQPRVPPPWTTWWAHQHSGSGRIEGVEGAVDLNVMREA